MKKILFVLIGISFVPFDALANPYVSLKAAFVKPTDSYFKVNGEKFGSVGGDAAGFRLAVGNSFALPVGAIRAEIEAAYNDDFEKTTTVHDTITSTFDTTETKDKSQAYFLNAYYDFDQFGSFVPYIGTGIGVSHLKSVDNWQEVDDTLGTLVDAGKDKISDSRFAYQFSVGMMYKATDRIGIDVGYRFSDLGKIRQVDAGDKLRYSMHTNEFSLGIRYSF